jgi:malate dehydrogenase
MVYITHKVSGFERNRVFGMGGMLDASRFRQFIHEATGHSRNSIRAMVIGEHGEHMLPLTRYSSVSGIPLCSFVPQPQLDAMVKNTREVALKVIQTKGATVHAPGNAIASMIEAVVKDQKQLIPVSTYLDGEYGYHDLVLGVPAVIGRRGVESIMDLDLNDSERRTMDAAAESVRTAIASLDI